MCKSISWLSLGTTQKGLELYMLKDEGKRVISASNSNSS